MKSFETRPKVSIVLSSYNHAKYIQKSIDSALAQTFEDYELIIADDCSTDNSFEIIMQNTDKRIVALRNEKNSITENFFKALRRCRGEYIAVHHSGDLWRPDKLRKQVEFLDANPQTAAVFTHVMGITEDGRYIDDDMVRKFRQPNRTRHQWLNFFFYNWNALCHPSAMMRRELAEEIYTVHGPTSIADWGRWIRTCCSHEIHILQEPLTIFQRTVGDVSTGGRHLANQFRVRLEALKILNFFRNLGTTEDWLLAFPELAPYVRDGEFVADYAFARLCLEPRDDNMASFHLFGIMLLFDLLGNEETRLKLERIYGFTVKEMRELTGGLNIFAWDGPWLSFTCGCLVVEFANGKIENLSMSYTPDALGAYEICFDLRELMSKHRAVPVRTLYFMPTAEQIVQHHLISCEVDGVALELRPVNAEESDESGEYFTAASPIYTGTPVVPRMLSVTVRGNAMLPSPKKVFASFTALQQQNEEQTRALEQAYSATEIGYCPVCGKNVFAWRPLQEVMKLPQKSPERARLVYESNEGFCCPHCGSMARERITAEFLLRKLGTGFTDLSFRLMEFAPRDHFKNFITRNFSLLHETADLYMDAVDYTLDLTCMPELADNSVDAWISLHMLEHIADDAAALSELRRILKPGGFGALIVPVAINLAVTDEDPSASPEERASRFGQEDHIRTYSKTDFIARIKKSGLKLNELGKGYFGEECFSRLKLEEGIVLYLVEK